MNQLKSYTVSATDWREALLRNKRNTRNVVILFIIIYLLLGFLIDVYINFVDTVPIETTLKNLLSFKVIPIATLLMLVVAGFSLIIAYYFHEKLVMLGTDYCEVTADNKDSLEENQLYNVVEELKIAASLRFMPKVFIIDADYMNAFASGLSEKSAMVAITRGLLDKLDRSELQAVMAHEISHIRHNDIELTVMVVILSNLMLIAIDLLFRGVIFGRRKEGDDRLVLVITLLRFLLPIITILLMLYLSRTREYMADAGGVELTRDNEPLARALLKIDLDYKENQEIYNKQYAQTANEQLRKPAYLYDPSYAGISSMRSLNDLFSTHPSLEARLKALGVNKK